MDNLDRNIPVNSENIGTDSGTIIAPFDYGSNSWEIFEIGIKKPLTLDFAERFDVQSVWQVSVAKAYVYSKCIEFEGSLSSKVKLSSLYDNMRRLSAMSSVAAELYGDKLLSEYQEIELLKIACHSSKEGNKFLSKGGCRGRIGVLGDLYRISLTNHVADNEFLPSIRLTEDWEKVAFDNFAPVDLNAAEWATGGSLDTVPFEISLAILTYCIEQLRSPQLSYLLAWNELLRSHIEQGTLSTYETYVEFLDGYGTERSTYSKVQMQLDEEYFAFLQQYFPNAKTIAELRLQKIPFALGEALDWNKFYRSACFLAFIILTGVRYSEAANMRFDAIKRDGNRFIHSTPLVKTNDSVEAGRPIGTGLISTIVDVMSKLGSANYNKSIRPLFFDICHFSTSSRNMRNISFSKKVNQQNHIHDFYDRFLEDHGEEMEQICPKITAHAFRHTWAEFALRRFDGHITPLIADHFRHAPGQFMNFTPAYTAAKLTADEYREIGNRYIFDIIDRYIVGAEDLYGAMGRFIKSMVDEKVEFIDIHDRDERARLIKDIQQATGRREVNVDSKGICLVSLDTPEQANCTDAYGIPKTDEATPDMCNACPMHCKTSSHVEEHKRLTMAYALHAEQLKDEPILFALFGEEARKEHQIMLAAQKKMET